MRIVESSYLQFPFGIECPQNTHDRKTSDYNETAMEVILWFQENDMAFQRDWIRCSVRHRESNRNNLMLDAYLFRDRNKLLLFKFRFAGR